MKKRKIIPLLFSYCLSDMQLISSKETHKAKSIEQEILSHAQTKAITWGTEKGKTIYNTHEKSIKKKASFLVDSAKQAFYKTTSGIAYYCNSLLNSCKKSYKATVKKIKNFFGLSI